MRVTESRRGGMGRVFNRETNERGLYCIRVFPKACFMAFANRGVLSVIKEIKVTRVVKQHSIRATAVYLENAAYPTSSLHHMFKKTVEVAPYLLLRLSHFTFDWYNSNTLFAATCFNGMKLTIPLFCGDGEGNFTAFSGQALARYETMLTSLITKLFL